jgi:ferredoxin-nitrite reductase
VQQGRGPIERLKAEKDRLQIVDEIEEIAAQHGGWETLDPGDRERLKWAGLFYRKPTPGRYMLRVRITNGQAAAAQLRCLAEVGGRLGNGVLDLTTRQQVELRALEMPSVPAVFEALRDVDLTSLQTGMDNIRTVNSCALAGPTPNELFDASPVGAALTKMFLGNPEFSNLPRKLNITITGCLDNCTHSETQDIAMTPALAADGRRGFNVVVGGKMGSGGMTVAKPLDVFIDPESAAALAAEIARLFRDELTATSGPRRGWHS